MFYYLSHLSPGWLILGIIILFIGLVSQIALYAKAGKPGFSALVPVWNVIVFIEIVGRPKWHSVWILVPGTIFLAVFLIFFEQFDGLFPIWQELEDGGGMWVPGPSTWDHMLVPLGICAAALIPMLVFIAKVFTEVCDSFGKHKLRDKVYCIIFNGAYLLFVIGISDAVYECPWYAKKNGLPYTMPELKGKTNKEAKSELLSAIADKYKKKK